jgi:beta-barrel assembly-enhancing protease
MRFVARSPKGDDNVNVARTHPLREAAVLVAGITVVLLLVLTTLFLLTDVLSMAVPPALEAATFEPISSKIPGVEDERREDVARVLGELAALVPDGYEHPLAIIGGPPNAMAVIGGPVLVTVGLLDGIEHENDLAFVLAHELGHFAHRDQLRGLSRKLAGMLLVGALFGTAYGGDTPEVVTKVEELTNLQKGRSQESDADRFALRLLHKRYGHGAGATAFFARMAKQGGGGGLSWFSSHPLSAERIKDLERWAKEEGIALEGPITALPASFGKDAPAEADNQAAAPAHPDLSDPSD